MTALHPDFLRLPLAHRGLHDRAAGRIENAPASFTAAIAAGYGIELDLQLSSDGQAMVFHDYELDRLTGETGFVSQRNAAELGQITLTDSTDTIPTLPEVLASVAGQVPLLIELKDQSRTLGTTGIGPLEQATARALADYAGPVAVMSFNPASVAAFVHHAPGIPVGLTTGGFDPDYYADTPARRLADLTDITDFDAVGAQFISHYVEELATPAIARLKARGVPIFCWTVRSADQEATARQIADNITFEGYAAPFPAS